MDAHQERFLKCDIAIRALIPGRPLSGKAFYSCGGVDLFKELGFQSFLVDLPKVCYPKCVHEFYGNSSVDRHGDYVLFVRGTKIKLNSSVLSSILSIDGHVSLDVYTKKGVKDLVDLSALEQLRVLRNMPGILIFPYPTTSTATPLAHALFKVCLSKVCPRLGSRSNFSAQDVVVCAMLLSKRKFDLSALILSNDGCFLGYLTTGIPYGCLLSRVFDWYGVNLEDTQKVLVKEFLDLKSLTQSRLKLEFDGSLVQIEPLTPVSAIPVLGSSSSQDMFEFLKYDHVEMKAVLQGLVADMAEVKKLVHLLTAGTDAGMSPGLDGLANAATDISQPAPTYKDG